MRWASQALEWMTREPVALVSLLAVEGSTPREAGTRMVVTQGAISGTIGGGNLEFQCIDQARQALRHPPGTWRIQDYPLGVILGQCCGGRVRVMIEHLDATSAAWLAEVRGRDCLSLRTELLPSGVKRRLVDEGEIISARGPIPVAGAAFVERIGAPGTPLTLFGAGHVGIALARVLEGLPFRVTWLDDRTDVPAGVITADAAGLCRHAGEGKGITLIVTHDHALDYELTKAALSSQARFIGLIGSATKRARFLSRLRKDGVPEADIARITCPIGLPGIAGKAPEVIAVAVAAQILQIAKPMMSGEIVHERIIDLA